MRRVVRALLVGALLTGATLTLFPPGTRAQTPAAMGDKVKFNSVDGVELHGTFYAGSKKNATILMVHAIGGNGRQKEFTDLAKALQEKGHAVLTFDLRGHGQSTSVDPTEFWSPKYPNYKYVAGASTKKDSIEARDIRKEYYSVFVNDIAAAKAFLDRHNDAGECNSSNLIVLGADSGATLGAIWMNSEWSRFKLVAPIGGIGVAQPDLKSPEGKNVICGIWLSITPDLGMRKISLTNLLFVAGKDKKVPMVFLYNSGEARDKSIATSLATGIKGKDKKAYDLTAAVPINAGPKLTGHKLLTASLGTEQAIIPYVEQVKGLKDNEWQEQEFRKSQYIWRVGNRINLAKGPGETALRFSLYSEFIPSR